MKYETLLYMLPDMFTVYHMVHNKIRTVSLSFWNKTNFLLNTAKNVKQLIQNVYLITVTS